MGRCRYGVGMLLLAAALAVSLLLSVGFGSVSIAPSEAAETLMRMISSGGASDDASEMILWNIRVPRSLFAALCGAGLSLAGLALQTVTRNDLADPYVLGVSSGASAGAVAAIVWGWFSFFGTGSVSAGAFLGAALSTALVVFFTGRSASPVRLVLVGMGISAFFAALTMMIIYSAVHESQVRSAMFWLLGSFSGMQWRDLPSVSAVAALVFVLFWFLRHDLDLMLLGEEEAEHLGLAVKGMQLAVVLLTSAAVAVLVSRAGTVGFVGLIVPHMARSFAGPSHTRLLPAAALIGALVMVWADVLSRSLFAPEEMPIGVLTALAGAPLFIWIVCRKGAAK